MGFNYSDIDSNAFVISIISISDIFRTSFIKSKNLRSIQFSVILSFVVFLNYFSHSKTYIYSTSYAFFEIFLQDN